MTRPLVLLPPSKGKAAGGSAPRYGTVLRRRHPLGGARREVAAALVATVGALDDMALARVAGVRAADVAMARAGLAGLYQARTLPARERYTGVVHGNAGLAEVDPAVAAVDVRIVSPLLGLAALDEPVPAYRLELAARVPGLGGLASWWRPHLDALLPVLAGDARVWDLLPGEHRRALSPSTLATVDRVDVRFVRPDGRPANAARTKVAKGRLTAYLLAHPRARPHDVARAADLGQGWRLAAGPGELRATWEG